MYQDDQAHTGQAFGPTFFALAGFVNAATLSSQSPAPAPEPMFRKRSLLKALFGGKRRQSRAANRSDNRAGGLSPTLGAIAGFVTVATGGAEPE